jgi:hypothetical protein
MIKLLTLAALLSFQLVSTVHGEEINHTFHCKIYASEGWQKCGQAKQGNLVKVTAHGSWKYGFFSASDANGGGGWGVLLANCPSGALIASQDFEHGVCYRNGMRFVAPKSGPIYFRINDPDNELYNNSGYIEIDVEISE